MITLRRFCVFVLLVLCSSQLSAAPKRSRILFLLDASSSMTYPWNAGYSRFEVASTILLSVIDSMYRINNEVEFAVRAYGTQSPAQQQNCTDTYLEVPFNLQNTKQINIRLRNIRPLGSSPIAYSLEQASWNELRETELYDYSVIFITDGGESCGGDVCGVYQRLLQQKIAIKPFIIGLDQNEKLKEYYNCLGSYLEVREAADIPKAVQTIVEANRMLLDKPRRLNLKTEYANPVKIRDTVVAPVAPPVEWVFRLLNIQKVNTRPAKPASLSKAISKIKRSRSVTLRFNEPDFPRQDATARVLSPMVRWNLLKPAQVKLSVRKPKIALQKKVALAFEYEEAKKQSPALVRLLPYYKSWGKVQATQVVLKPRKPRLSPPRKAALAFEYIEPKKVSPPLDPLRIVPLNIVFRKAEARITLPRNRKLNVPRKAALAFEYEEIKRIPLQSLRPYLYPRRYTYANRLPNAVAMKPYGKTVQLRFAVEEKKKDVVKRDTVLFDPNSLPTNSIEFSTKVETNTETEVQVYFLGTNGKTYPTAKPMILMQDMASQKTVTQFTRDMKGNEPVPQKVPAGRYNLVIKGFDDLYANNIEIKPNTLTKITVKVSDGTLKFTYQGNLKRPMKEFTAIVNRRFAAGATVKQNCAEALMYEPGTYYVEVNTLPPYKAVIDLNFDAIYEIQIPESGTLMIMNTEPLGKIQIQSMLGDQYVTFHTMNITGNPSEQKVNLRPLMYRIVYPADPQIPQAGTKQIPIRINSNIQSEIELK